MTEPIMVAISAPRESPDSLARVGIAWPVVLLLYVDDVVVAMTVAGVARSLPVIL